MIKMIVIGFLGSDAKKTEKEGKVTISFSIAKSEKRKMGEEKTVWISCFLNKDSRVVEYLKKGSQVYLEGYPSINTYQAEGSRETLTSFNLSVERIELLSGRKDVNP